MDKLDLEKGAGQDGAASSRQYGSWHRPGRSVLSFVRLKSQTYGMLEMKRTKLMGEYELVKMARPILREGGASSTWSARQPHDSIRPVHGDRAVIG